MVKILSKSLYISKDILRKKHIVGTTLKTNNSSTLITPILLWKNIMLYTGKNYIPININKDKIGFKLNKFIFKPIKSINSNEFNIKLRK